MKATICLWCLLWYSLYVIQKKNISWYFSVFSMGFLYLFYFCISTLVLSEYESCKDNIESYCPYIIAEQGPKYIRKFLFPFFHHIVLPYILSVFLHLRRPSLTSLKFLPFYSLRFFYHLSKPPKSSLLSPFLYSQCPIPKERSNLLLQLCQFSCHCRNERIDDFGLIQYSRKLHVDCKHWPAIANIDVENGRRGIE